MLKPITQRVTDESEGGVFRFTFYCDICGSAKQSPPYKSETEGYNDAYERANREMIRSFNRCPVCMRFVCDDCFYLVDDKYICKECNAAALRVTGGNVKKKRLRERGKPYFAVVACLVLFLGGIGILTGDKPGGGDGPIDIASHPVPLAAFEEVIEGPGYLMPRIDSAVIPAGTTGVELLLFNPAANECDLAFEIVLDGETLYKSGPVAPGMCIENVALDETLGAGEHRAVLIVSAYGQKNNDEMDGASMEITITAE